MWHSHVALIHKELTVNELLIFYEILVTHTKSFDKIRDLLVILNHPEMIYIIRIILKDAINVGKVLGIQVSGTQKVLSIDQYFSTAIYNIHPK